jgi:glutamine synthetase
VNSQEQHEPHEADVLEHAKYMRDSVLPPMADVRSACDRLERLVADDLWALPRYSEMLFIK